MGQSQYAQLNIGRNEGDTPMSDDRWAAFQRDAVRALALCAGGVDLSIERVAELEAMVQTHLGLGEWDGVPEDSAHLSVYSERGVDVKRLTGMAEYLASKYGQDSVAVVAGSVLAYA
jgi:hypothetical protein